MHIAPARDQRAALYLQLNPSATARFSSLFYTGYRWDDDDHDVSDVHDDDTGHDVQRAWTSTGARFMHIRCADGAVTIFSEPLENSVNYSKESHYFQK